MGTNIAESLQELNAVKLAIKGSIERKGVDISNTPFAGYAAKIDGISAGGGEIDMSNYCVIINVSNGDGSELTGQVVTVNEVEYPLTGTSDSVWTEGAIGTALSISFSAKNEFYKPGNILYNVAADVLVKVLNVTYVPIAQVVNYGYKITEATYDPLARVEYTDDAVGKVKGSADWDIERIFREIKPCLFKNGAVVGYLNPNDFTKFEDGTAADIISGNAGDVMIEFPKIAYKMSSVDDVVSANITNNPDAKSIDPEYSFNAFSRISEGDRDHCYIGAYCGWVDTAGKLRSLSGKPPAGKTMGQFRECAQKNGDGYQQMGFYQLTLLQHLYLVKYGSTDSQAAVGKGYTGQGSTLTIASGICNSVGMNWGVQDARSPIKLLGIENIYGNVCTMIDGLYVSPELQLLTSFKDFNNTGVGYTENGIVAKVTTGVIQKVQGGTNTGFLAKGTTGYNHYADKGNLNPGYLPVHGGAYNSGADPGIFAQTFLITAETSSTSYGSRLCFV